MTICYCRCCLFFVVCFLLFVCCCRFSFSFWGVGGGGIVGEGG